MQNSMTRFEDLSKDVLCLIYNKIADMSIDSEKEKLVEKLISLINETVFFECHVIECEISDCTNFYVHIQDNTNGFDTFGYSDQKHFYSDENAMNKSCEICEKWFCWNHQDTNECCLLTNKN